MMKRIKASVWLLLLMQGFAQAQTKGFAYHTNLDTVREAGFYNIQVIHPLHAHAKTDFSDVRIVNNAGKWVPHLLRLPADSRTSTAIWVEMPFERKELSASSVTCVVKNSVTELSAIELLMRNTTAQRVCSISGSFDDSNWFIINDSILLQAVTETTGDKTKCRISFPPSSYPYIKVVIESKKTDPVNIISIAAQTVAHNQAGKKIYAALLDNPNCTIIQKDSAKISYIQVTQKDTYQFERLSMLVSGIKYFNRKVDLFVPKGNDHSFANPGSLHESFTISNNSSLQFAVPHVKTKIFYLLVHNDDNLPLTVNTVKTALKYRVLTAYLEKGNYQLITGNDKVDPPVYDLARVNTQVPDSIPVLEMGPLAKDTTNAEIPMIAPGKDNKLFLWIAIGLVLAALLYFSGRLAREVNKRKAAENDHTV
jgi:hypothetical protein